MNLTVTAGPHGYKNCPLKAAVEIDAKAGGASLVDASGKRVPCQVFDDHGKTSIAWIEPEMKPRESKTYTFDAAPAGSGPGVEITDVGGDKLEVKVGGKVFTAYNFSANDPRPYLYPFIGPKETQVTRNFPMKDVPGENQDHPHHRSVYVAYGEVNGTDNWSEEANHAWIRHIEFEEVTSGPVFGRIRTRNRWDSKDGLPQMEDVREFTFYSLESERLMDVSVKLIAAHGDAVLTDTKEGGIISVRVATSMDGSRDGMIVNAYGGRTEAENWGKPAHWVDYYGPVEGKTMGITIMDHPSSFRYPARWHVRDYGLFTANPFALKYYEPDKGWNGDQTIKSGEQLNFAYRLYIHEGTTEQAGCTEKYLGFIAPPKVEVS